MQEEKERELNCFGSQRRVTIDDTTSAADDHRTCVVQKQLKNQESIKLNKHKVILKP